MLYSSIDNNASKSKSIYLFFSRKKYEVSSQSSFVFCVLYTYAIHNTFWLYTIQSALSLGVIFLKCITLKKNERKNKQQ